MPHPVDSPPHVRAARPDDAAAMASVQARAWTTAYRDLLPSLALDEAALADAWREAATAPPSPAHTVVGFDASGIVVNAFAGAGIKLPRSSGEQYKVAAKVAPSQALPGDLIFFGPDGTQSVALFVGNGQMLEATDTGIKVSAVRTANMTPYLGRIIA